MNAYIAAQELLNYFSTNRGAGHTTAMLEGAKNKDCIVLIASHDSATQLKEKATSISPISLQEVERGYLSGNDKALVLDNAALQLLLADLVSTIASLRKDKEEFNNKIRLAKSILS